MKNLLFLFVLCSFCIGNLVAQTEDVEIQEYIFVLKNGILLKGKIEKINDNTIQVSKGNKTFLIDKKNIQQTITENMTSGNKEIETESLVILKNKDWLTAQVLEVTYKSTVVKSDGVISRFPTSKIFKIYPLEQEDSNAVELLENEDSYSYLDILSTKKENEQEVSTKAKRNFIHITYGTYMPRVIESNGYGIQHTSLYKFNQTFGIGLNLGFVNHEIDLLRFSDFDPVICTGRPCGISNFFAGPTNLSALTAGLTFRDEFGQKKSKFYYSIDFGFNKALRNKEVENSIRQIVERSEDLTFDKKESRAKLGYVFQPSIGMQVSLKSLDLVFDLGFQFANLNYEDGFFDFPIDSTFSSNINQEQIRGFVLRMGIKI